VLSCSLFPKFSNAHFVIASVRALMLAAAILRLPSPSGASTSAATASRVDVTLLWMNGSCRRFRRSMTDGLAPGHKKLFFGPFRTVMNRTDWRFLDDSVTLASPTGFEPVLPP
jgi:hypothetical protein